MGYRKAARQWVGTGDDVARTFFRIVQTDPPTRNDFLSYEALGKPLRDESQREMWSGISVQATEAQARGRAKLPTLGRFIAELRVPDEEPIVWKRTGHNPGHHTLWGDPDDLLDCVVRTFPVEKRM